VCAILTYFPNTVQEYQIINTMYNLYIVPSFKCNRILFSLQKKLEITKKSVW